MNSLGDITTLILKIMVAAFAAAGLIEFIKNFIKTEKTWIFSVIMPFVACGCFLACEYLPIGVIGCILTIGTVQLDYQVIVQGFKKIINGAIKKVGGEDEQTN